VDCRRHIPGRRRLRRPDHDLARRELPEAARHRLEIEQVLPADAERGVRAGQDRRRPRRPGQDPRRGHLPGSDRQGDGPHCGTVGGYTDKIIDKNTPIPIEKSKSYTTNRDGQEKVKIRVYQGESSKAAECELLGEFEFSGFRIGYRGEVRIEVTFEIDTNGIVNVTAADVETGQKTSCTIRLSSGL